MSNLTTQDTLTVGVSYWLNQRADGKGVNIAGVMRDTALSREVVKAAIAELETKHREWLEEYKAVTESEAVKILAEEQITRLRSALTRSIYQIQADTMPFVKRINRTLLAEVESLDTEKELRKAKTKDDREAIILKFRIKATNLDQAIGRISRLVGMVERLEMATQPKVAPVFNNQNIQLTPEEKKSRFLRLAELEPLPEKNANNGS